MRRRQEKAQKIRAPQRQDDSAGATRSGQQQAFDEELANQASAAGTQRRAHRHFFFTCRSASQQQIRHVDAGDQQDQHGYDHQEPENAAEKILYAVMRFPHWRHVNADAVAATGIGIFLRQMRAIVVNSDWACAMVTPGRRRPRICTKVGERSSIFSPGRTSGCIIIGTKYCASMPTMVPKKCGGATPITVKGCPLICTVRPTTLGSEAKSRFHRLWPRTM